jgi:hypothetical protein
VRRIFLDANVIFTAAHNPTGKAALLIELAAQLPWQIVTSRLAEEEARRNLENKYPQSLPRLATILAGMEIIPGGEGLNCPLDLPAKDRPIFEATLLIGATHLLTGDIGHFGPHMNMPDKTSGIIVQTVADFFRDLTEEPQA